MAVCSDGHHTYWIYYYEFFRITGWFILSFFSRFVYACKMFHSWDFTPIASVLLLEKRVWAGKLCWRAGNRGSHAFIPPEIDSVNPKRILGLSKPVQLNSRLVLFKILPHPVKFLCFGVWPPLLFGLPESYYCLYSWGSFKSFVLNIVVRLGLSHSLSLGHIRSSPFLSLSSRRTSFPERQRWFKPVSNCLAYFYDVCYDRVEFIFSETALTLVSTAKLYRTQHLFKSSLTLFFIPLFP